MAVGDIPQLNAALNQGLDTGLTVSEIKEILGQLLEEVRGALLKRAWIDMHRAEAFYDGKVHWAEGSGIDR